MLIKKILMSSVDLFTHVDIYSLDIKQTLLSKLAAKFTNICYSGLLILRIVRLIEYGDCLMVDDRLDGGATCDVKFEVEGLQMVADEVLCGCRVVDITSSGILFESQYADGLIMTEPTKHLAGIITKGMTIPVTIITANYPVNHNKLTITGMLFNPRPPTLVIYKITGEITEMETNILKELMRDLSDEIAKHTQTPNYIGANKITYPFANTRGIDSAFQGFDPVAHNIANIKTDDLLKQVAQDTFAFLPCELFNDNKLTIATARAYDGDYIEASQFVALADFINRRLIYLQTVRQIATHYDTPEKWKSLNSYWQIVMSSKPGAKMMTPAAKAITPSVR